MIRTEYKIAFPHLYHSRPRDVELAPYHHPTVCFIKNDDPDVDVFHFDEVINPISAYKMDNLKHLSETDDLTDEDFENFTLPEDFQPLLHEEPLFNENTNHGINLYWAPKPFNQRTGKTRRCFDVPLVSNWF